MKSSDIRQRFLDFFAEKGHEQVHSSPVIPQGDPTLLFTNAGMNQFKDVFLGLEKRAIPRATTSQKCIRAGGKHNDLENVGRTERHQTFFEMLGNFSFGDYFKREAISYAWEFLTEVCKIPRDLLVVTVFREDEESAALWREIAGLPDGLVVRLGEKDNFWSMGDTGPCGPCTEIHFDYQPGSGLPTEDDFENGRYVEVWNLVFMQFDQKADGTRVPLPAPSVDTGMGLERLSCVLQNVNSNYKTDLFASLLAEIAETVGVPYDHGKAGVPHRVIADHVRALSFSFADGALPSNTGRGYVLRRILRRAARFAYELGVREPVIYRFVPTLVAMMGDAFPELRASEQHIITQIRTEEESFQRNLERGMIEFEKLNADLSSGETIPGEQAFTLYDTHGFPLDMTCQMAEERGLLVDHEGFEAARAQARERSAGVKAFQAEDLSEFQSEVPTEFLGYTSLEADATVLHCTATHLLLNRTPFYPEGGGQVADHGRVEIGDAGFVVEDTQKHGHLILHVGHWQGEVASSGAAARAKVDRTRREDTMRNHTATHLLHWALRGVLGEHVRQQGSKVHPDYLRFDLAHNAALRPEELAEVEARINAKILLNEDVQTYETQLEAAKADGVIAFFDEKYGEDVRVVRCGEDGYSSELCGGTHCQRTGDIGMFAIVEEKPLQTGVRRIVAYTGRGALQLLQSKRAVVQSLTRLLSSAEDKLLERTEKLIKDLKQARKQGPTARPQLKLDAAGILAGAEQRELGAAGSVYLVAREIEGADMNGLRELADRLKGDPRKPAAGLLAARQGSKVFLVAFASKAIAKTFHAGNLVKGVAPLVGGGGGGRPDMAQAGGKNPAGLPDALKKAQEVLASAAAS